MAFESVDADSGVPRTEAHTLVDCVGPRPDSDEMCEMKSSSTSVYFDLDLDRLLSDDQLPYLIVQARWPPDPKDTTGTEERWATWGLRRAAKD